jgi:uncharacterized protein YbjT (DUF2867 family)
VRVAVLGATGVVGRAVVPLLASAAEVVAVSRGGAGIGGVAGTAADVLDAEAVGRVLAGCDVAVHLVHSLGSGDFAECDRRAAENVGEQAARAGVRQIVYLGGLGEEGPEGLSPHLRSRRESALALSAAGVPVTTLGAAMIVGRGSAAFETILALVDRLPVMVLPRWGSTPTQPIALADAAAYVAGVCGREEALGRHFDLGGPEQMSYREMIERMARIRGRRRLLVEVPVLTPNLSSWWLHLVTPVTAAVARPLVEGLRTPTLARDEAIRELVPLEPTPFDEAVRRALSERPAAA